MHEATIAAAAIEQAIEAARSHGATRITRIELEVGAMREVVPEAMAIAFEACAIGTMAEGAKLDLHETAVRLQCRGCGGEFGPDLDALSFVCPACGAADGEMLEGNRILLKSVECETDEEARES